MGVRLYGDPSLAIRELYQNALDACRYRDLRTRYQGFPYRGRISFAQGFDEAGREYIECVDNGVGMGRTELENVFSKAGRRFVNSTDFLWEQAEWLQKDESLRLWPNSRFGIGVFSYFMLADEIFIETARVDRRTNTPRETVHVRIASSGSLFRITTAEHPEGLGPEGGTRVRLYLRSAPDQPVSCVDRLRELLWYSEVDVEARDAGRVLRRPAGEVCLPETYKWSVPVGGITWVGGAGMVLSDGIATNLKAFGYVVNLTGERSATLALSIDRNTVEEWDREWVREQLMAGVEELAARQHVTFTWMQAFARTEPKIAQELMYAIDRRGHLTRMGPQDSRSARLATLGIWPTDTEGECEPGADDDIVDYGSATIFEMSSVTIEASERFKWDSRESAWKSNRGVLESNFLTAGLLPHSGFVYFSVFSSDGHPPFEPIDVSAMLRPLSSEHYFDDLHAMFINSRDAQVDVADLLHRTRRFVIHGAVPPPVNNDNWARVADAGDFQVLRAIGDDRRTCVVLAELSHRTGTPLAGWIERANAILRLQDSEPIDLAPEAAYICGPDDAAALAMLNIYDNDFEPEPADWLDVLLGIGGRAAATLPLLRALGKPADLLWGLAEAVWDGDDDLVARLSQNAAPGPGPGGWLADDLTPLDFLIAVTAGRGAPAEFAAGIAPYASALGFRLPADIARMPADPAPAEALPALRAVNRFQHRFGPEDDDDDAGPWRGVERPALLPWLCAQSGLSPAEVLGHLEPYRVMVEVCLPDRAGDLPDRRPTRDEAGLLSGMIVWNGLGTTWRDMRLLARRKRISFVRVLEVARLWHVPVNGEVVVPIDDDTSVADSAGWDNRDRAILAEGVSGSDGLRLGVLSASAVLQISRRNDETISRTLERVERIGKSVSLGAEEFDWGDLRDEIPLPLMSSGPSQAGLVIVCLAGRQRRTLSRIIEDHRAFLRIYKSAELTAEQLRQFDFVPDELDVLSVLKYDYGDDYRWDALHVVRVAARLGAPLADIAGRVTRLIPLLTNSRQDATGSVLDPGLAGVVPDWRDVVILTPGLDGRRLLTDADITDDWIAVAAREVETTTGYVRERLALYAGYCGFTAPTPG